jgi:hypothetical protein
VRKVLGVGLLALLFGLGCSSPQPRQGIVEQTLTAEQVDERISASLEQFYYWLVMNRRLINPSRMPPPRELDPNTLEPIPEPPNATTEEIIKRLEKLLQDPKFRKEWEDDSKNQKVEADSGSPTSTVVLLSGRDS